MNLDQRYPPSNPCSCHICRGFCVRPGWWTVEEASRVLDTAWAYRMMLEISPERDMGILSPAFKGNEAFFALQQNAHRGCTFLKNGLCELFGTGLQPLECRFCHHDRIGIGVQCHLDLENDWRTLAGQALVLKWIKRVRLPGF